MINDESCALIASPRLSFHGADRLHNLGGARPNVLPIKAIGVMGLGLRSAPTASTSDKAKRGGKLMTKA